MLTTAQRVAENREGAIYVIIYPTVSFIICSISGLTSTYDDTISFMVTGVNRSNDTYKGTAFSDVINIPL